ncbi:GAF and ANTAR domain-containing protein [Blastococcus sp. TF02A-26]|uniref:GAF and ANTAR domain-containing protein n=1 Tax=Blastococcus sp. TF02A-26 TaxID=2250577 RepID=UPI000DE82233|nr:GAF and ANTAR domain-containing protein [Blastococcus sp. TF02A-26]RBY85985.1 antitermination regulator [Blastococcus sp. TF02A-26]
MGGTGQGSGVDGGSDVVRLLGRFEDVTGFLDALVRWAVDRTPGAEACGLTLEEAGREFTVTYSGELAHRGDERQYELDDGPCLQALRSGQVVTVDDMVEESRWGRYPERAVEAGVLSSLSFPLSLGERGRGALNLYASRPHAFTTADGEAGRAWAGQASGALLVAWQMADREKAVGDLAQGMETRQTIGQAVGLLMAQRRCTADEAFALLKGASQRSNEKLRDVAARMVAGHEADVLSSR